MTLSSPINDRYFHEWFSQRIVSNPETSFCSDKNLVGYVEHLFKCEICRVYNGLTIVQVILSHEYCWFHCYSHEHSKSQNVFLRLLSHSSKNVSVFSELDHSPYPRTIWILTTNSNSVSSSPKMNCCGLALRWGRTTGLPVLSWFFSSKMTCLYSREKRDWNSCVLAREQTTGVPVLSSINSSAFHSWESQAFSSSHPE